MRKLFVKGFMAIFMAIMILFFASPSFAAVGIKVGATTQGTATDIQFASNSGGQITNDGSNWQFNLLLAGIANGGGTTMTTADLAVPVTYGFVKKAISADSAFAAGTLADGVPGQLLAIYITQDLGSVTYTLTPDTSTHIQYIAFADVGDIAVLLYIDDTVGWVLVNHTGLTVTLAFGT